MLGPPGGRTGARLVAPLSGRPPQEMAGGTARRRRAGAIGGMIVGFREAGMASEEELRAELEKLKAENAALKSRGAKGVSMKVSEKGAVSVYGLGRFPVTLYQEQWLKLLDLADDIRAFVKENEGRLKKKE